MRQIHLRTQHDLNILAMKMNEKANENETMMVMNEDEKRVCMQCANDDDGGDGSGGGGGMSGGQIF